MRTITRMGYLAYEAYPYKIAGHLGQYKVVGRLGQAPDYVLQPGEQFELWNQAQWITLRIEAHAGGHWFFRAEDGTLTFPRPGERVRLKG